MNSHYLSISYKNIINNKIIHYILFLIEVYIIFLQIIEIDKNKPYNLNNYKSSFSILLKLIIIMNKIPILIKFIIYIIIIIFLIINYIILNLYKFKGNIYITLIININEILFYRILSLFMFNYLFSFRGIYLFISIIITIPYLLNLLFSFYKNHLFVFFPNIIRYPYDSLSVIIDLHFLGIKLFLSISGMALKDNSSQFFFLLAIFILYILFLYLTYIMIFKSYYFMTNCSLNKVRYSVILSICIIFLIKLILDKNAMLNIYSYICCFNILLFSIFFICYFYNPYDFVRFNNDDSLENVLYYFFILNRDKNNYFLLEEKIEEHISKCDKCNLCKKYKNNTDNKNGNLDLFYIIFNGKNFTFNLMNNIIRDIKKYGKDSFSNNSYYLINVIYIYSKNLSQKDYNSMVNTELMYEVINSENSQILDEHNICLDKIKYANNFLNKAKYIIEFLYEILEENKMEKITQKLFKLGELLDDLKYKEIKSNNNNYNGNSNEGLPNCNNLLTICSLFYEELYNESITNSGIYIRESPNILEDLININYKNIRHITLEIDILCFKVKIIRAGGHINNYINNYLFDLFPIIFKNSQIKQMKDLLLSSNNNIYNEQNEGKKQKSNKTKKWKENKKQKIKYNFIIEEKEDNEIYYRLLKLKLSFIYLTNISTTIYLNGIYSIDKDIIVTEQKKGEEAIIHFGNIEQINSVKNNKNKNNNIITSKNKKDKYLGNHKLIRNYKCFIGCKKYNVYHFLLSKKSIYSRNSRMNENNITKSGINPSQDGKSNLINNSKKILIFNDIASQASSTTSSLSKNNFISYNRGNKQSQKDGDITKEFKIIRYILIFSIFFFFICIILEDLFLTRLHNNIYLKNDFYLNLKEYDDIFQKIVFSILSLTCIGDNPYSSNCEQYMGIIVKNKMDDYIENLNDSNHTSDFSNIIDYNNYSGYNNSNITIIDIIDIERLYYEMLKMIFVDFVQLLFNQTQIFVDNLENILEVITKYLSDFDGDQFINKFKYNVTYSKIYQNYDDSTHKYNFSLTSENISFFDFILLLTSRLGILTKDINDFNNPIYFLNKSNEYAFNNVYSEKRLNSFQENIYLLILDSYNYFFFLQIITEEVGEYLLHLNKKFKKMVFLMLNLNFILILFIIAVIFCYIIIYFVIILKILQTIHKNLNEKLDDKIIKDIFRKKIDNLKLLLSFYEYDINTTINDLNNIYNDYRDSYNLKLKEEQKTNKKEEKNESNNKKINLFRLFEFQKKLNLLKYSGRKNIYLYGLLFSIIICIVFYCIACSIWETLFKKDYNISQFNSLSNEVISSSNQLMQNFIMMIFENVTLEELSEGYKTEDFFSLFYSNLTKLYHNKKYLQILSQYLITTEANMNYNCLEFYSNLNNKNYMQLYNKYSNDSERFLFTMYFFCEKTNIMTFKNYKTIYLQLFSEVQIIMEDFTNNNYNDIIQFINRNQIVEIEIVYLITYTYLLDLMSENIKHSIVVILKKTKNQIYISFLIFLILIIILILIIYFLYIRNVSKDTLHFVHVRKVFKICNMNE